MKTLRNTHRLHRPVRPATTCTHCIPNIRNTTPGESYTSNGTAPVSAGSERRSERAATLEPENCTSALQTTGIVLDPSAYRAHPPQPVSLNRPSTFMRTS